MHNAKNQLQKETTSFIHKNTRNILVSIELGKKPSHICVTADTMPATIASLTAIKIVNQLPTSTSLALP